jgi:hypothetical protein
MIPPPKYRPGDRVWRRRLSHRYGTAIVVRSMRSDDGYEYAIAFNADRLDDVWWYPEAELAP